MEELRLPSFKLFSQNKEQNKPTCPDGRRVYRRTGASLKSESPSSQSRNSAKRRPWRTPKPLRWALSYSTLKRWFRTCSTIVHRLESHRARCSLNQTRLLFRWVPFKNGIRLLRGEWAWTRIFGKVYDDLINARNAIFFIIYSVCFFVTKVTGIIFFFEFKESSWSSWTISARVIKISEMHGKLRLYLEMLCIWNSCMTSNIWLEHYKQREN